MGMEEKGSGVGVGTSTSRIGVEWKVTSWGSSILLQQRKGSNKSNMRDLCSEVSPSTLHTTVVIECPFKFKFLLDIIGTRRPLIFLSKQQTRGSGEVETS